MLHPLRNTALQKRLHNDPTYGVDVTGNEHYCTALRKSCLFPLTWLTIFLLPALQSFSNSGHLFLNERLKNDNEKVKC